MKIAIFGASVSHQTVNRATGEVTGYTEILRRDHAAQFGASEICQITYPGNRLSDGGLVRLADVVAWHVIPALLRRFHDAVQQGCDELVIWGSGNPMREFLT